MKKRIWCLIMALMLSTGVLGGCGKKNIGTSEDSAMPEETLPEKKTYKFGFSCMTMENPYFIILEQSLRQEVEAEGHTMITKDPAADVEKQVQQIDEMIADGIEAIFLCPVSWERITPALEDLKAAGVKIINIDSEVKDSEYIDAYVGSDNKNAGAVCGKDLVEQCPDGGKIVILESPTQNSINDRITGFEGAIANKGFEVVAREDVQGDLVRAKEAAMRIFAEHKDITAVMCGNDQIALGALVAAHAAGLKELMIYGVDGSPDLKKELVKPDSVRGTCGQSPIKAGEQAAKIGAAILSGEKYEKKTYEEVFFISAENVEMYGVDGWQ